MNVLEKFAAVEIQVDNRISEDDKIYCERQQSAYETAIDSFKELAFFWADMEAAQEEFVGSKGDNPFYHNYLVSRNGPSISKESIEQHIASLHTDFIMTLTRYFNSCYHVTVNPAEISHDLLPKKPDRYIASRATMKKYNEQMQDLTVRYQDVVDQIILRLDGRSFADQAFYELYSSCHSAAWNNYQNKARFERKKDTIVFTGWFCNFRDWPYNGWELDESMKKILRGLAHFETGSYQTLPERFSELLGYQDIKDAVVEFPTCEKIKQMKLFKNNRVDLKFHSPEFAEQFVTKYLGTVC